MLLYGVQEEKGQPSHIWAKLFFLNILTPAVVREVNTVWLIESGAKPEFLPNNFWYQDSANVEICLKEKVFFMLKRFCLLAQHTQGNTFFLVNNLQNMYGHITNSMSTATYWKCKIKQQMMWYILVDIETKTCKHIWKKSAPFQPQARI